MGLNPTDLLLEEVAACARRILGFRPEALEPRALERACRRLRATGLYECTLLEGCRQDAPAVVTPIVDSVAVDETYFFRGPAQFELVADVASRRAAVSEGRAMRAWSAGCANGAEAYSLAATLRASVPPEIDVEVLGTDIVARNVDHAKLGTYGEASLRDSGGLPFPTVTRQGSDWRVAAHVRPLADFAVRNLLGPPPLEAHFDFVFCRNVLVYMTPEATERVLQQLLRALAPGGALVLGAGDLVPLPKGALTPIGAPGLAAYSVAPKDKAAVLPVRSKGGRPRSSAPTPSAPEASKRDVVALHLQALSRIEHGDDVAADRVLAKLLGMDDAYLPGIVERALLLSRRGEMKAATSLMADVLRRTAHLPREAPVAGPRELPLRFYRQSARAFLERRRVSR